ncbi:DUF1385 domain-containing protein [Candidatus Bipolaricaulota bacterium]|nr:DUF1385 domain-containing protein [Candidatus Bipolaricaulota bacterium]
MPPVGGQAVLEGVMMQNGDRIAVAVRRQDDQKIVVRDLPIKQVLPRLSKIPVIRGVFRFVSMLVLGIRALNLSASLAFPDDEQLGKGGTAITMIVAVAIAVGVFVVLPLFVVNSFESLRAGNSVVFNLIEGVFRLALFLAYVFAISRMKEIKRVFQYHGAEHKTVHAYEAGLDLTVDNARTYTTLHPRCGTAFLMIVLVIAILVFSLAGNPTLWLKLLSRILLLPVVAGVSYEVLQYTGRHADRRLVRAFSAPGLWLQRLTTAEPTDDMLEVAIASLKHVTETVTERDKAVADTAAGADDLASDRNPACAT